MRTVGALLSLVMFASFSSPAVASPACRSRSGDPIPTESISFNFSRLTNHDIVKCLRRSCDFSLEVMMPIAPDHTAPAHGWIWTNSKAAPRLLFFTGQPASVVCRDMDEDGVFGLVEASLVGIDFRSGEQMLVHVLAADSDIDSAEYHPVLIRMNGSTHAAWASRILLPTSRR